jgi:UDP:flavonoid glycosyltransferase YjiC (YdhE family)
LVHEKTRVPWISAAFIPAMFPHVDHESLPWLWPWHEERVRERLGFGVQSEAEKESPFLSPWLTLLANSEHFGRPLLKNLPHVRMTGFWFNDDADAGWVPPPELQRFLSIEPKPLVLTLGSMRPPDPGHLIAVLAEAAQRLGRRLIVLQGWGGLTREASSALVAPELVFFSPNFVPYTWLFPRAAAVIHHGGIGTTAEALRWGCPMIVLPIIFDQFLNGRRIRLLGLGTAMDVHRLTVHGLVRVLEEKVLVPAVQQRAAALASCIQQENGLDQACDLIEERAGF